MNRPPTDLATMIGSRLCHDLVSPLSAISNGIELLQMMQGSSPEIEMLNDAVTAANARIRLFRLAFGAASQDQTIKSSEIRDALVAFESAGRIKVDWALPTTLPRQTARKLMLAALCAENALAYGGNLVVTEGGVEARAPRFNLDQTLWQSLSHGTPPFEQSSATVHFSLLALDGPVLVRTTADSVRISL